MMPQVTSVLDAMAYDSPGQAALNPRRWAPPRVAVSRQLPGLLRAARGSSPLERAQRAPAIPSLNKKRGPPVAELLRLDGGH